MTPFSEQEVTPSTPPPMERKALDSLLEDLGPSESQSMLVLFQESLREYRARLTEVIASGDLLSTKQAAHGLKGLCMQFGATHGVELARLMELNVKSVAEAEEVMARLVREIDRVEAFVKSLGNPV